MGLHVWLLPTPGVAPGQVIVSRSEGWLAPYGEFGHLTVIRPPLVSPDPVEIVRVAAGVCTEAEIEVIRDGIGLTPERRGIRHYLAAVPRGGSPGCPCYTIPALRPPEDLGLWPDCPIHPAPIDPWVTPASGQ